MKKFMLGLCVSILMLASLGCSNESTKDFRDVSWGSKLDKVISIEKRMVTLVLKKKYIMSMRKALNTLI